MALTVVTQCLWDSTTCPKKFSGHFKICKHLRFWQWSSWGFHYSGIWCCIRVWLPSDMATYTTVTIYFKKSYFVVHYLTRLWANNSGCMVRGMQLWLLRLWNHEFRSRLVYAWPHLSVCIVMWRYRSCDELLPYPRSPTKCLTDSYFLELIPKWDKP
jgi:hypothetical protein